MKTKNTNPSPKKAKSKPPAVPKSPPDPEYPQTESGLWEAFFDTDEMSAYVQATEKIREAEERGDEEVSLPTEFLSDAIANTVNFTDAKIIAAWNRCCDLAGLPEKKRDVEGVSASHMHLRRNLKVGHALKLKKRGQEEQEGGEGGPF